MYRISIALVTLFLLAAASSDVDKTKTQYTYYRLPESIRPDLYHLKIITNLDEAANFTFNGEVSIRFLTLEDTRNITLHVQNLTVDDARIELHSYNDSDFSLCLESVDRVKDLNYYVIGLCQTLAKNQMYELKLYFNGVLNDEMRGYYRSSYVDESTNVTKWLSVTQFEPLSARLAFPCLDEPNYKAKFIIWLGHHKSFTALSNMPLEKQIPLDDLEDFVWSIFEESVAMSTYLVAYTVNDFVYKETKLEGSDVVFRTWCRRDFSHQCELAADVAPNILKFYEEMFKIPFPLKKVDQIAIPDFNTVAMENWGLITYQEMIFLSGPNNSSPDSDLAIVKVVAHELAHQWFGNLVTMKWWTDVWLNEGFATYIASLGASSLNPELESYNMDSFHNSMEIFVKDAELSSHPISQTLSNCSEIMTRFDSISYKKGSAVLRMMHMSMGHDWFFEGVCQYLNKHKYENAEQDDLWEAFTESGHQFESIRPQSTMKIIMDSWTLQAGYPLIKVERNYETGSIDISQQRFLLNSSRPDEEAHKCWWVPLSYTTASELDFTSTLPKAWLECAESGGRVPLKLDNVTGANDWIIFNIQLSGVYRVMYDLENWRLIANTLNSERFEDIHVLNRAQILENLWTMTWNGYQHYNIYLTVLEYLNRELENLPWETVLENIWELHNLLKPFPEPLSHFQAFMRYIIEPVYHHLGGLRESKEMIEFNTDLIRWACRVELEDCVQTALNYFQQWKLSENPNENNTIPDNYKQIVYCTAIIHGNNDDWTFLWQRYNESQDEEMLIALGCSRNQTLLRELLNMFYAQETNLEQGDLSVFYSMIINEVGVKIAREYIFDRISKWSENFDLSYLLMLSFHIAFPEDLHVLNNLIDSNEEYFKQYDESVKLIYEKLNLKLQWMERNLDDVQSYLQNRLPQMGIIESNVIDQET